MKQTLTLIRGTPGSGKTTLARMMCHAYGNCNLLHESPYCFYYEADMFMIDNQGRYKFDRDKLKYCHDTCFENAIATLKDGYNVIVSNTFVKRWEMERYRIAAEELNIPVIEIVCKGRFKSTHNVPAETVHRMEREFEF